MKAKDILKNMKPYKPGKGIEEVKKEFGLDRIVKLASNENPFGFSPVVEKELPKLISNLEIYPDGYGAEIRKKVARFIGVEENQLIFGNGSDEVVQIICRTFLEPGANTVMATPTFPQYRHNALIEGAEVREVPLIDGHHDLEGMLEKIDEQTRVLWICTPNNPTGVHIDQTTLQSVLERTPDHVLVVIDEAYYEYLEADDAFDSIEALNHYPNLMVLRTFSKAYGLAGLRIGYGVGHPEVIQILEPSREPFNTSTVAQAAALMALDDQKFIEETVQENWKNKKSLMQFCENHGLNYFDTQANFLLIHLPCSGDEMFEYLLTKGFIVRSGEALGLPNTIRLTIGKKEDMQEIQEAMKEKLAAVREQ
ncbi:histidinol-phosphate transaminase [Halobacillus litoralis]|uniref:Histidinol-phosphate aminotransferase n=1 Tax=Halobacillus litoralis TaxID=45668 RepID=A0A845FBJ9_9BACI|nr:MULTISPECIES: histidinol-phosphate transaminase [Halobacillus]MEC3885860.1 histidinol-phosphate transaminase [Halobacillus sp. HZG1]MYL71198.1 histidinol-phosphate transaminase [Halobacillus litoralis]